LERIAAEEVAALEEAEKEEEPELPPEIPLNI